MSFHIVLRWLQKGNWIINLFVLLCNFNVIISRNCDSNNITREDTLRNLPPDWPCHWDEDGNIPYVFNYYTQSPKRLTSLVRKGLNFLEERSCLSFKESNPITMARKSNSTYLYFTYSGVLENCCLPFYSRPTGRRLVLVTPMCTLPGEIAHITLHGLGLKHNRKESFSESEARAVLFSKQCRNVDKRIKKFDVKL